MGVEPDWSYQPMLARNTRAASGVAIAAVAAVAGTILVVDSPCASAATTTLTPTADTYVDSLLPTTNYGDSTRLSVVQPSSLLGSLAPSQEIKNLFLKFDLSAVTGTITSAKLRLHVADDENAGSASGGTFTLMSDHNWSPAGVTYGNQPSAAGPPLGTLGQVTRNTWVELDLTGKVAPGSVISIGGSSTSSDSADYDSKESGANAPQLVITTAAASTVPASTVPAAATTTPTTAAQNPPAPPTTADPVLVGAGDIADGGNGAAVTAELIKGMPNATVFTAGDNAYDSGSMNNYNSNYQPTWGAFKSRTRPAPGNHEYETSGAAGYYQYFGSQAGPSGQGYYSYDLGNWHIVSLNSEVNMGSGSAQETWLRSDLAASKKPCTLAYWHQPLFTSGANHAPNRATRSLYQALYDANADVVVTGHNHQYERFAPQDPNGGADKTKGIVQFVVGTGGAGFYPFGTIQANSVARNSDTHGVVKFTLRANSADYAFVPAGGSFTDSGTITCH
ncbi:MAG: DNRLRE domain-containing protein [Nocardiaceae bacterium]|nr:DNRLRE domain-containing protein [Nocardiaceae bacterium]